MGEDELVESYFQQTRGDRGRPHFGEIYFVGLKFECFTMSYEGKLAHLGSAEERNSNFSGVPLYFKNTRFLQVYFVFPNTSPSSNYLWCKVISADRTG